MKLLSKCQAASFVCVGLAALLSPMCLGNEATGSSDSSLTVEILDEQLRPIPAYSGNYSLPLEKSGFHESVAWRGQADLGQLNQPIRARINWNGEVQAKAKLHAIYIE
jgi:hypothetical protein